MRDSEEQVWRALGSLDPAEVCSRAKVSYDSASGSYSLRSFGADMTACVPGRRIVSSSAIGNFLVGELGDYFRLSALWYLVGAKDIPLSGEVISPTLLPGGDIFLRGTHALPLDTMAAKYGRDTRAFLETGLNLGGTEEKYADASIKLLPFPKVPVIILLWRSDTEFPARSVVLLDSTSGPHFPTDILWATVMMSVRLMIDFDNRFISRTVYPANPRL